MDRQKRVYESLLVVYPFEHRREYGEPMAQLFADRLSAEGGGARTILLWAEMLLDLIRTALMERLETTMKSFRANWWRTLALPVSLLIGFAGVGNMFGDTEGALFGRIAYAVAAVVGLGLVVSGLVIRKRNRKIGSSLIAVGVMPGIPLIIMFWYPPAALLGALSIAISIMAFLDAPKAPQSLLEPVQ